MENEEKQPQSILKCNGEAKPTAPPEGKFNGHYDCTENGWVWVDDID